MLFYRHWMSRWKNGSDTAHRWRERLLRTSAVSPHSDCCCHSGQRVSETKLGLGVLLDHVWSEKAGTFPWEWIVYMRLYAACVSRFKFICSKAAGTWRQRWDDIHKTLRLTTACISNAQGVSPELVSHKDDPAFQQEGGKNTDHLSYAQTGEQTFKVHVL